MRIAVLDDEPNQLDSSRLTMEGMGHSCHCFTTAASLQQALPLRIFDLLVLEWALPDIQGPALVKWIRDDRHGRLPIMFLTHRGSDADIVEALDAGADDYMVKPTRGPEFQHRVRALLRRPRVA